MTHFFTRKLQSPHFALLLCVVTMASCSKDFLNREPVIGSTTSTFYQTASDAQAATIACYAPLQVEISEGSHFRWFFGDIVSDDADKGGSGDTDGPDLLQFANFTGDPSSTIVLGEWKTAYKGITYCNIALENIPGIEMDELEKAALLAEAHFLRAYWYFNLVTTFGGVPLVTSTLSPSEYAQSRSTAQEVWTLIVSDLEEAAANLPIADAYSDAQAGRATRGAANALLAKTHLYLGNWSECRQRCEEVHPALIFEGAIGEYFLEPDFGKVFTEAGENGSGSIWEIQYANNSGGNWGAQFWSEGSYTNVFQRPRGDFAGYGFNLPTQSLVDEFETFLDTSGNEVLDPRFEHTIVQIGDYVDSWGDLTEGTTGMPHPYYARKYLNKTSELAPFGDPNPNGGSNDRVIRLADVILMHAEACNALGDDATAQKSLNFVRQRAGVPLIATNVLGDQLRDVIYHERRVELALEGHRFFDLVRQGRAASVLENFVPGKSELFPIPTREITLSNGLMTQNPGYE